MKLGLGTAQFGLPYGATNRTGRLSHRQASRILRDAFEHGVRVVDTAPAYGDAERVLGQLMESADGFHLVTKTSALDDTLPLQQAVRQLVDDFHSSLKRLDRSAIYGLLVHRAADLMGPGGDELMAALLSIRDHGYCERVGVSVYTAVEALQLANRYPLDIVQLPVNVLDQRMVSSGVIARLKNAGIEVHGRSIFLQGILVCEPSLLDSRFDGLKPLIHSFQKHGAEMGVSPIGAALAFAKSTGIDIAVCGAASEEEWLEILRAFRTVPDVETEWGRYAVGENPLVDPRTWTAT